MFLLSKVFFNWALKVKLVTKSHIRELEMTVTETKLLWTYLDPQMTAGHGGVLGGMIGKAHSWTGSDDKPTEQRKALFGCYLSI